jgi:MFS family permease
MVWGTISACTGAVQSYSALLGIRVLLGASEAVFFPGVLYFLSAWYTKRELGKRYAGLFIGQQLGNGFGGLIAAGVLKMDGLHGIRGWRWLFILYVLRGKMNDADITVKARSQSVSEQSLHASWSVC